LLPYIVRHHNSCFVSTPCLKDELFYKPPKLTFMYKAVLSRGFVSEDIAYSPVNSFSVSSLYTACFNVPSNRFNCRPTHGNFVRLCVFNKLIMFSTIAGVIRDKVLRLLILQ